MNNKKITGLVVKAYGKLFWVQTKNNMFQCVVRDSLKLKAESVLSPVVVGDYIDFELLIDPAQNPTEENAPHGVIFSVHPRKTRFSRPKRGKEELEQIVAANLERILIITSVARPQFKPVLIDRFLLAAFKGGLEPVIVINKIDLDHGLDIQHLERIYNSINVPLITTSATHKTGLDKFVTFLKDKISIVAGQSGVGKSSLLNAVEDGLSLRIGEISKATQKGIHTTTAVEMFPLSFGGYVADTPGLKYLGLWDIKFQELQEFFSEIWRFSSDCKFRNCLHKSEPGCAVRNALKRGEIFQERYDNYLKILKELETISL